MENMIAEMVSGDERYHMHGNVTHSTIAKSMGISPSLSHLIENSVMLKFGLALFNPPWQVKNPELVRLRDTRGKIVRFDHTGEYFEELADVVYSRMVKEGRAPENIGCKEKEFQREYERNLIRVTRHPEFKKFVVNIYENFVEHEEMQ